MVKVTVVQDGKKVFEEEGDFFTGAVLRNMKADYSSCVYGNAKMTDILALLTIQGTGTLKAASDD